jgi:hypothetical protein
MMSLLVLTQEALERATNPAYGVAVNDEHAARLAAVLGPEDVERFAFEVALLDDPTAMASYSWAWVLEFAIGHGVVLDRGLLTELCQRWDEPALKALVIETALGGEDADRSRPSDEGWLEEVIALAAPRSDTSENDVEPSFADDAALPPAVDTASAEALLTALLVVRTDATLNAARQLLNRSWAGADQLAAFLNDRLEDSDPLAREPWIALRT